MLEEGGKQVGGVIYVMREGGHVKLNQSGLFA